MRNMPINSRHAAQRRKKKQKSSRKNGKFGIVLTTSARNIEKPERAEKTENRKGRIGQGWLWVTWMTSRVSQRQGSDNLTSFCLIACRTPDSGLGCPSKLSRTSKPKKMLPFLFKAVTWLGYTRDRLPNNCLELFLPSEHSKIKGNKASKKAPNFLEVPLCTFPRCSLIMRMTPTPQDGLRTHKFQINLCATVSRLMYSCGRRKYYGIASLRAQNLHL